MTAIHQRKLNELLAICDLTDHYQTFHDDYGPSLRIQLAVTDVRG